MNITNDKKQKKLPSVTAYYMYVDFSNLKFNPIELTLYRLQLPSYTVFIALKNLEHWNVDQP